MVVNNIKLPIYEVGDEIEYIGGQDAKGQEMFYLEEKIQSPYIVTKIGIDIFNSAKYRDTDRRELVLKFAICINHSDVHCFVPWMFKKINV